MKNDNDRRIMFLIMLMFSLVFILILIQSAAAAPAWKKASTTPTKTTTTSTNTAPTTTEKIIIINNTQGATPSEPWYKDWNFIGVAIVIIGGIVGWLVSRKVRGKTAKYMSEIDKVYRKYNTNTHKCEAELTNIREQIEDDFKKGKINDQALSILDKRIDKYAKELRSDIVNRRESLPEELKRDIKHMLSDGVISNEEYEHFSELSKKAKMSAKEKEEITKIMKRWKEEDKK